MQSPSKKNPLPGMNMAAMDVWVHILSRYSDQIFNSGCVEDQWLRAALMFERACKSRGIEAYTGKSYVDRVHKVASALRKLALSC